MRDNSEFWTHFKFSASNNSILFTLLIQTGGSSSSAVRRSIQRFSAIANAGWVYPNAQDYVRMGQIWFNAIYEHLVDLEISANCKTIIYFAGSFGNFDLHSPMQKALTFRCKIK